MKKEMGKHSKVNSNYVLDINISNIVVTTKEHLIDKDGNEVFIGESKIQHLNKNTVSLPSPSGEAPTVDVKQQAILDFIEQVEELYADLHTKL